jgi:hypothetical protein
MTKKQDPDPLVRGFDPWIRIRIQPKMLRIRNTVLTLVVLCIRIRMYLQLFVLLEPF